jgi:multidrug resistance efflux pump
LVDQQKPEKTSFMDACSQLSEDRGQFTGWAIGGAILMLCAWLCWALFARVTLYEVSSDARIELDAAAYPMESPLDGKIANSALQIGKQVRAGDVLVEIDSVSDKLVLEEGNIRLRGLQPELERLRDQIGSEEVAEKEEHHSEQLKAQEAESRLRQSEITAEASDRELRRIRQLHADKLISERDWEKSAADNSRLHAEVAILRDSARRISQEQAVLDRERAIEVEHLRGELAKLEDEIESGRAGLERLGYEVERRRIRAPIDGRIGESVLLHTGGFLHQGQRLASIIPDGRLHVVAQYPAEAALGRIRIGQSAAMRLQAFPWSEFGTVSATVTAVAQEIRDGKVRVELAVSTDSSFHGQLQHGMPGELEITTEHVSPLSLVSRTAGQWLTRQP